MIPTYVSPGMSFAVKTARTPEDASARSVLIVKTFARA
jgi:hypothetical protein